MYKVSPRKGRWIEMVQLLRRQLKQEVSPRKGRWIEIVKEKKDELEITFLPVRGDGLKSDSKRGRTCSMFLPVRGDGLKFLGAGEAGSEVCFSP